MVTKLSAQDFTRVVALLEGKDMTPVRWLSLVARLRDKHRRGAQFAERHLAILPLKGGVRINATVPLGHSFGSHSVAQWGRSAALEALDLKLVPEEPRVASQPRRRRRSRKRREWANEDGRSPLVIRLASLAKRVGALEGRIKVLEAERMVPT